MSPKPGTHLKDPKLSDLFVQNENMRLLGRHACHASRTYFGVYSNSTKQTQVVLTEGFQVQ